MCSTSFDCLPYLANCAHIVLASGLICDEKYRPQACHPRGRQSVSPAPAGCRPKKHPHPQGAEKSPPDGCGYQGRSLAKVHRTRRVPTQKTPAPAGYRPFAGLSQVQCGVRSALSPIRVGSRPARSFGYGPSSTVCGWPANLCWFSCANFLTFDRHCRHSRRPRGAEHRLAA